MPPARIKITPPVTKDHLRRMSASLCQQPFESAFALVLFVIDTVSEGRLRASASRAKHAFEVWTQNQDRLLSRLYRLRNAAAPAIECGPQLQVLNQVVRNLIQDLQMLNQKVR